MAGHRIVSISELDDSALESLAMLHESVIHTLLTDLGLPFVRRYYQIARVDESVISFYLVSLKGELVGWVIGSPDPNKLNKRLQSPASWFAGQIIRLAITRASVLWQLWSSVFSSSNQKPSNDIIELTYLGVSASSRGSGLGSSLVQAFIDASRTAGYRVVELSVEKENSAAIGLYVRFGFKLMRTFTEGHFERQRMSLVL